MVNENERFLFAAYSAVLGREPRRDRPEYEYWLERLSAGLDHTEFLMALKSSPEWKKRNPNLFAPLGHYYSPIVNADEASDYVLSELSNLPEDLHGINLNIPEMLGLLSRFGRHASEILISEVPSPLHRFDTATSDQFKFGDAWVLKAVMREFNPRRIIEIGSGFSTACMLDAIDEFNLTNTEIICIEPDPERLLARLKPQDRLRMTLHTKFVQDMKLELFQTLEENDILFIDSSHVMKSGSDVHFEFFHILPALKPGVFIHFHDCGFPFEYPIDWLRRGFCWNELYVLRAFLMHNEKYMIRMWSNLLHRVRNSSIVSIDERLSSQCGSSIWIQKIG